MSPPPVPHPLFLFLFIFGSLTLSPDCGNPLSAVATCAAPHHFHSWYSKVKWPDFCAGGVFGFTLECKARTYFICTKKKKKKLRFWTIPRDFIFLCSSHARRVTCSTYTLCPVGVGC